MGASKIGFDVWSSQVLAVLPIVVTIGRFPGGGIGQVFAPSATAGTQS
jgi:hypothetical protein